MSAHRGLVPDHSCGRCWYCDAPVFPGGSAEALRDADCASTRDHVNPQRLKEWLGPDGTRRTVQCCAWCNGVKGHQPAEIYLYWLRHHGRTGTRREATARFNNFVFALTLAGFRAARRGAMGRAGR